MISFGSTYKINQKQAFEADFADKLYGLYRDGVEIVEEFIPIEDSFKTGIFKTITLVSPDEFDKKVESILASKGINFHKTSKKENLNLENIKSRMVLQDDLKETHTLVEVDVKKLDELLQLDNVSSLAQCKNDERFKNFYEYLETGLNIHSPIIVFCNDVDNKFGVHIEDGRHRFAILRDMGMKKIPVAVSNNSLKFLKKFELI